MAPMNLSRRGWMAMTGGALLAAGSAAAVWKVGRPRATLRLGPTGAPAAYVDHEGWMVTPADKQRLVQTSQAAVPSP